MIKKIFVSGGGNIMYIIPSFKSSRDWRFNSLKGGVYDGCRHH